ncbi:hypothetical protein ILYODFUR_038752 [Ilyodon furcidens]|uniref:OB domain-containing protein n=1 Tax=Ilyodon furcidens TaxID=33524 RepID=A0ABV0VAC8_9TELE
MKGYSLRGESTPFVIIVTRETTFYRSSPVSVDAAFIKEATELLYPPSKLSPVSEVRDAVGLLTVEGQIIQLSVVKNVKSGREGVPLRHLKIQQDGAQVTLCLWREAAVENLEVGARIQATHLKLTRSSYGEQLQTTSYTQIEVVHSSDDIMVEVLGVTETINDGILELLLSTDELVEIEKSLWEPFDYLLSKQRVHVQLIRNGGKVVKIEGVQPPAEN